MNLEELNTLIEKLSETRSREGVFEFAFALIDWMGLQPVEDKKPRLLAPQTQKLKDYLVPVPTTVQPQLYRLTAEGQPIRVRFATLKKIKKEYIYQLVDNDPGLTSYQASIKGIVNLPGRPAYIPSEPYFIHFITTPDYNKLILVFNQGDQKRIITFRNRLSQTQYYRVVKQWQNIGSKSKPELTDIFWRSLDVKEVNKEFYQKIKERFDDLVGLIQSSTNSADENHIKQFAVRLIGRYVFIWFLKEKEIVPSEIINSFTISQNKQGYYQNFLLRLFFQTLNTEVQQRNLPLSNHPFESLFANIPYLNGGLFEDFADDRPYHKFVTDEWLIAFVKVLESYDFTVDESSVQYQQAAIDPEMLGRIFENLLASQNPETEKLANQRKAFGAFYTPREIVEYMVDASLKAYLEEALMPSEKTTSTHVKEPVVTYSGTLFHELEPKQTEMSLESRETYSEADRRKKIAEKIEKLFSPICDSNPFEKKETPIIQNALRDIKVLDPACGSGAFPIGMLLRLMNLREIVGNSLNSSYELKNEILSRNIYGVDIMPMAVEIARLRAWLSLVLEVDYKLPDRKHNFNIKALPNLDFKFICANSLIGSGYDEFSKKIGATPSLLRLDNEIKKLERLREKYFDTHGDKLTKSELQKEFVQTKELIKSDFSSLKETWNLKIFLDKVDDWDPFDDSHASSFFSSAWMFGINDGFDVVIGNPPYVRADNPSIAKQRKLIMESGNYVTLWEKWDLMIPFIERSILFLANGGINTFILSNSITTSKYAEKLQDWIIENFYVKSIDYFEDIEVFEAGVVPVILSIEKVISANKKSTKNYRIKEFTNVITKLIDNDEHLNQKQKIFRSSFSNIFTPEINSEFLGNIFYMSKGMVTNSDEKEAQGEFVKNDLISETKDKIHCKEYVEGKYIKAYKIEKIKFIEYDTERVPGKLSRPTFRALYAGEKILRGRVTKGTFDDTGIVCNDSIIVMKRFLDLHTVEERSISTSISKNNLKRKGAKTSSIIKLRRIELENISKNFDLKYILAIINSSYAMAFLNNFRRHRLINYFYPDDFRNLPIPSISLDRQRILVEKVNTILSLKAKRQDTTSLEREIDLIVYKLYELSYQNVKKFDQDFWLSEDEYDRFEVK